MSLPSAVRAIGLGDIRVDSALNEPLSAQIDIVGATRDELAALTAKVASREVFQRYGADRPSFLSSATFKVGLDALGRPVLNIRSSDAFTDPLVSFLVDLRWGRGELVREYSLLLDPAGFGASNRAAQTVNAAASPTAPAGDAGAAGAVGAATAAEAPAAAPGASTASPGPVAATTDRQPASASDAPADSGTARAHYRVTSNDTLRAVARRTGAGGEVAIQRTMIALFRANPHAFDGNNINRLHLGALLLLPTAEEVAAIPATEAKREVRAHMTAWRLDGRPAAARPVAVQPAASVPAAAPAAALASEPAATPVAAPNPVAKEEPNDAAIAHRLQTLEEELDQVHQQLAAEHARIQVLTHASERTARAAEPPQLPSSSTVQAAEATPPSPSVRDASTGWLGGKSLMAALATGMGLLVAGFVYLRRRQPGIDPHPYDAMAAEEPIAKPSPALADRVAPAPAANASVPAPAARPVNTDRAEAAKRPDLSVTDTRSPSSANETTVSLAVDAEALERSYIDSLPVDALGIDSADLDSGTLETAEHALSDIHAAETQDTAIVDPSTLDTAEHDVAGLEAVVVDPGDLDAEIDREALNTAVLDGAHFQRTVMEPKLDYNLVDLDSTAQYLEMPSKLHDRVQVLERRTNIADVLKAALERDPNRRDLRLKLLETYYSIAASNRRAFLEIAHDAARDRDLLSAEDWDMVRAMGREIADGDPLFVAPAQEDDLANCA